MQQGLGFYPGFMFSATTARAPAPSAGGGFWSGAGSFLQQLAPIATGAADVYLRTLQQKGQGAAQQQAIDSLLSRFGLSPYGSIMPTSFPQLPPPPSAPPPPPPAQGFQLTTPMVLAGLGVVAAILIARR